MTSSASPAESPEGNGGLPLAAEIFCADSADAEQLRRHLLVHPAVDVRQVASDLSEVGWAETRLLFCDLDQDGKRVLARLAERPSSMDVILCATDEKWAAAAFETDALDFLVKPIARDRLGRSMRRLLRLDWSAGVEQPKTAPERVFVPFERGRRMIAIDEICAIHAVGNYTQVLLPGGATEIVLRPLRRWEETLAPGAFLRIHRSTLINAARLRKVEAVADGDGALAEVEGLEEKLPVSRRCLGPLRAALRTVHQPPGDRSSQGGR